MGLELIFGLGIVAFLLVFLATRLDNNDHVFLRFILIGFFFYMLILIGKAAIDDRDNCITFIENQTIDGNVTHFDYGYQCITNPNNTPETFYIILARLFWIFIIYTFIYSIWKILEFYEKIPKDYIKNKLRRNYE